MHTEYTPNTSISQLVKLMKWRTSRMLQKIPKLKKRYWGKATGNGI
ncbi:transposase [Rhodohalobacter sp. SW132]